MWGADILVLCIASTFAMCLPKWRPQGTIRRGRLASHCGTDLAYGHPGALHSIHTRNGLAIRYPNMAPQTDRPPRSHRCALRHRPGVRTSWCPAQHRHSRWVCPTVCKNGTRKGSSAAVASLRTAAQTWRADIRVPCTPSTCAMGLPYGMPRWSPRGIIRRGRLASHCDADLAYGHAGALAQHLNPQWDRHAVRYAKMEAARGHPPRSHRFALRRRPGMRTSWCAVQQPHLRGRLASHCGPDVGCGHPGALHRIHIRNAFAKMAPARYHPPRSPRFALRHRSGVRTSWCPAQHPHPQWVCHTLSEHCAQNTSSAAVASLRTAAQTWRADILVLFITSTSAMGLPYGMQKWRPRGIIRRGRFASHCPRGIIRRGRLASHCDDTWHTDILVPCTASKSAMGLPCCTVC